MTRTYRHWTPRYIKSRLGVMLNEKIHPGNPWLSADAVRLLDQLLKPTDVGVEFGSGRSTIWFAKRLAHLTSVESDPLWYEKVKLMLAEKSLLSRVDYRKYEDKENYAAQSLTFADASIDFCLVDGMCREKCAELMIPKIKSGGILTIDNIDWFIPNDFSHSPNKRRTADGYASEGWARIGEQLSSWRRVWTSNGVFDTAIWLKP